MAPFCEKHQTYWTHGPGTDKLCCPACAAEARAPEPPQEEETAAQVLASWTPKMPTLKKPESRGAASLVVPAMLEPVLRELDKAAAKFPTWPVRGTDAAAIVAEECGELQQAVLQATYEGGSVDAVRKEAIQTAAMAIQFLLNLPDTRFDRGEQTAKRAALRGQPTEGQ